METEHIEYCKGYKCQLTTNCRVSVQVFPERLVTTRFLGLTVNGDLTIRAGYAWDGPSGPTIDTKNFMRGSLVHDALYQLMRQKRIASSWRDSADRELRRICLEDGMSRFRAWYVFRAVQKMAGFAADPKNKKKIYVAP